VRPATGSGCVLGDELQPAPVCTDSHSRLDYLFVSEGMLPEVIAEQTRVVRDPLTAKASDHRPVIGVFRAAE